MQENAHTEFILCVINYIDRYVLETLFYDYTDFHKKCVYIINEIKKNHHTR